MTLCTSLTVHVRTTRKIVDTKQSSSEIGKPDRGAFALVALLTKWTVAVGVLVVLGGLLGPVSAERVRVALAAPNVATRLPFYVGQEEGFFSREGLTVEPVVIRGDQLILSALVAGDIDYATNGAIAPFPAIARGLPVVVIGGFRSRTPYWMFGKKGISKIEHLKGKIIGVTVAGGLAEAVVLHVMKKFDLERNRDYTIVYAGNSAVRMVALEKGAIDASVFSPAEIIPLLKKGYPIILDVGKVVPEIPFQILTTTRHKAAANSEQVVRFLRAMRQSTEVIVKEPSRALDAAKRQGFRGDTETEREALKYYADGYSISFNSQNAKAIIEFASLTEQVGRMDIRYFFSSEFQEKAMP